MEDQEPKCQNNFDGSANVTEVCKARKISQSVELCKLQCATMLCDSVLKVFNSVAALQLYNKDVGKEDCTNRVAKRVRLAWTNWKKPKKGPGGPTKTAKCHYEKKQYDKLLCEHTKKQCTKRQCRAESTQPCCPCIPQRRTSTQCKPRGRGCRGITTTATSTLSSWEAVDFQNLTALLFPKQQPRSLCPTRRRTHWRGAHARRLDAQSDLQCSNVKEVYKDRISVPPDR